MNNVAISQSELDWNFHPVREPGTDRGTFFIAPYGQALSSLLTFHPIVLDGCRVHCFNQGRREGARACPGQEGLSAVTSVIGH